MLNSQVANEDWSDVLLKLPAMAVTVITKILPGCKPVKWAVVTFVKLLYEYG